ncbi:putative ferric-chelate reductase 1 isoform X1 [Alosa sapidissima]|uniref:putative ferric-chelate reductase 1 isoform X1 n=2 Tax=Alosa sapidissima TaxID=34773 RepID=UPI001C09ED5B|nr:putative ferric-chelate reductase 1 isoform X1 [Alosa sapidissima]
MKQGSAGMGGKLIFLVTFLIGYLTTGIRGDGPFQITATNVSITRDGCGSTKLCLGEVGCDPAGNVLCSFISSKVVNASTSDVKFELFGNSTGYIALVLTTNVDQGGGLVFVCSRDPFNTTRNFLFRTATQIGKNGNITLTNSPIVEDITYNFNRSINGSFHQCTFTARGLSQAINNRTSEINVQASLIRGDVSAGPSFVAPGATDLLFITNGLVDLTKITTGNSPAFDPAANLGTPTATMVSITRDGCGSTKLCLGEVGCDPAGNVLCSFISSKVVNASTSDVKFELFGNSTGYIALVLTTNVDQGGGLVFVCSRDPFNTTRNFLFRTATQIGKNGTITLTNSPIVEDITYNFNRSINGSFHQCTFTARGLSQAINNRASEINVQVSLIRGDVSANGFDAPGDTLFRTPGIVDLANPRNATINATTTTATLTTTIPATTAGCSSLMHPLTQAMAILVSVLALRLF